MALTDALSRLKQPSLSASSLGLVLARWRRQWLDCLPRGPRLWLASRHPDLVIAPRGDSAEVFRDIIGERQLIGALDARAADSALAIDAGGKQAWSRTILELPAEVVLLRRLVLPAQVRDHLRQVLTYELDRLTPFNPAEVFFDARVSALLGQGSKLEVELALCPRERAGVWLETLRSTPTPVTTLTWAGAWPEANLLPAEARPRPRRLPWILTWLLGLLVVALLAAVLITPLWQRAHEQQRLTQALRGLSAQAQEVSEVREALERARLGSVAVLERKREYPRMTELMLELTELLPDGTWVQTLNYRDGAVDIRGESTQATALIGLLERGPGIDNVTFRSPVMQIDASGNERFHIAFDYRSMEAP
ncbi:PilN domain-containing protein [Halochromatium salexigens]|uniref:General secretion pathway protein L n=1 Tax=Halochromatium salexigens TaxID=49447 RepID=A0AAJ0UDI0_HALSE|nr:PilN domain-containing protein [Halochromatium salexigens]MBK5929391.1 hypothetical protein [Halochromatium salexigens]